MKDLTTAIKDKAAELGFQHAGVCAAAVPPGYARLGDWLDSGYAGQMHYIPDRREAYEHPRHVLDGARSLVMLAMHYQTGRPRPPQPGEGRVARYAWGTVDYHDLIHERLKKLCAFVAGEQPEAKVRGVVDTAPLAEREFAQLAGLGWVGKNTLLINPHVGSYFFLAALLTDLSLEIDAPHETDHCGTCRACLDACPTDAFPEAYVMDASRCISYLTIELREAVPVELRSDMGDWLFGCDVCQEVCPWNGRAPQADEPEFVARDDLNPIDAAGLFSLDDEAFRQQFRKTPLWRSKRRGLLRNAAIVLGNRPSGAGLKALVGGLADEEPLVRGACAWALGRYAEPAAKAALLGRAECESDAEVCEEIARSLGEGV